MKIIETFKSFFEENKSIDICTLGVIKEARGFGIAAKLLSNFI
jgi:hypothetical protein